MGHRKISEIIFWLNRSNLSPKICKDNCGKDSNCLTAKIKINMNQKDRAYKLFKKNKCIHVRRKYEQLRRKVKTDIKRVAKNQSS